MKTIRILFVLVGWLVAAAAPAASYAEAGEGVPTPGATTGRRPLCDMGAGETYQSQSGGLYGHGSNEPPPALAMAAAREAAAIVPLDADGKPVKNGAIVLLSIGMSNTTQEFSRFKEIADAAPEKSTRVVIVDGAQGGQDATAWVDVAGGADSVWSEVDRRLRKASVTLAQVQVIWLKQALKNPRRLGEFPDHAEKLKLNLEAILVMAKARFPNLRLVFLSSRLYAGYATGPLNPEPYAYEGAFAVRWTIDDQQAGGADLNWDSAKGPVKAPLALWGPYLWADGMTARADGLTWARGDLAGDGTHPSHGAGCDKVAGLLMDFFKTSPYAKPWFLAELPDPTGKDAPEL